MTAQISSPGRDLVRTVAKNDLGNAVFGVAEVALDHHLSDGVIRDIPFVGTLVNLVRAGQSISEELLIRKLVRFLGGLKDVPLIERQRLLEKYPDASEDAKGSWREAIVSFRALR